MHKARRRRDDLILRSLTYLIMTIAVVVLALLCLFLVLGYTVDQKTGRAEQGGLIQFRSFPDGANISIDGKVEGFNTPNKTTADATEHAVTFSKKAYRDWHSSFVLGHGELLWLNALLVPASITTNEVQQFDSISQTLPSPDKKWMVLVEKTNDPTLKIIDLRDEKNPKITSLKIPETIAKAQTPDDTFKLTEWDFGSRYLLLKHTSGATTEWLRLDRSDETKAENISAKVNLPFSELHFAGNSGDNFYGLSDGSLRKVNLNQTTPAAPIAEDVTEFDQYSDNKLALVTQKNGQQIVSVYKDGDQKLTDIEKITPAQPTVHVALSHFFQDDYVAISQGHTAKIIDQPFNAHPKTITKISLPTDVTWLYFSNNGQFLIAQNGALVDSYNLERSLNTQFTIPGGAAYTNPNHLQWLDDFHFWSDSGGTLQEFEFDGTNPEVISNVVAGQGVTLSNNGKRLFSIGTNTATNKPVLQSSVMMVE